MIPVKVDYVSIINRHLNGNTSRKEMEEELILNSGPMIYWALNKAITRRTYLVNPKLHPQYSDLLQEMTVKYVEIIKSYDPIKYPPIDKTTTGTFTTYVGTALIRYASAIVDYNQSRGYKYGPLIRNMKPSTNGDLVVANHPDNRQREKNITNANEIINRISKYVHQREFDILMDRAYGKTLIEISKAMGISKERVRQLEARGLQQARKAINQLRKEDIFILAIPSDTTE